MRRTLAAPLFLAAVLALAAPTSADDEAERRGKAIERAIGYLKKQQKPDGTWDYENLHPRLSSYPMSQGIAAMGALALLKAGVPPGDPAIQKSFAFMREAKVEHVYSAGLVLLAIDALRGWEPPVHDGEGKGTTEKAKKPRPDPRELDLAKRAVDFLVRTQQKSLWRYPSKSGKGEDSSNAQYALLGLDAAERIGIPVPKDVYSKAQAFYVEYQEKDGPEVKAFSVPGADHSIAELRAIEKELHEKLDKVRKAFKGRKPGETDADGRLKEDLVRVAEQEAAAKVYGGSQEKKKPLGPMRARGFPYAPSSTSDEERKVYGSMTASGVACLIVCKAHLEGTPDWPAIQKKVDVAIRDGAAWLAHNWSVKKNPNYPWHLDYYLYSLERAAILNLIPRFGEHDWYKEGCAAFIAQQKADGSFDAEKQTTVGPLVDTIFGLLFLARGTTPVIDLPERVTTGGGASKK